MNNINVNEIFENALKDPSLLSDIDIDELLNSLENSKNDYLENKTIESVNKEIFDIVTGLEIPLNSKQNYCDKLIGYRVVDELHELHKGKHVRWIRYDNKKLTNGGIVVDIDILKNGIHIRVKNNRNRIFQIKFDEVTIFQKLTMQEKVILSVLDHLEK